MSREKVCLTLFLSSAEGWQRDNQTRAKRLGRTRLPHLCLRFPDPARPHSWGAGQETPRGKKRARGPAPPTGLSNCAPHWAPSTPPRESGGGRCPPFPSSPASSTQKTREEKATHPLKGFDGCVPHGGLMEWGAWLIHAPKYRPISKNLDREWGVLVGPGPLRATVGGGVG